MGDWFGNVTILSGDIGTIDTYTDNCYHVVTGNVSNASLDGFTITKGYADGTAPDYYGGGLFDPIDVYNCIFEDNYASERGGAAWLYGSCDVHNCIFRDNTSGGDGGAITLYGANVDFKNCLFHDNSADEAGAVYVWDANPSIVNCTFSRNNATDGDGGGLYFGACTSSVAVDNCVFWDNTATGSGDQIFRHVECNNPSYSYCDIEDSNGSGENWDTSLGTDDGNNIDDDPEFVDAGNDDFHISDDSLCIDAADNTAIAGCDYDLDWKTRIVDGPDSGSTATVDMGCYEHHIIYVDVNVSGGDEDGSSWADAFNNIQDAIDDAQSGSEIWVADGTYTLTSTIDVEKPVSIYGGFQGNEISRSARNWRDNETIVDGDDAVRCFMITADATIDGFEIKNGKALNVMNDGTGLGGGIKTYNTLTIANCIFNSNNVVDTRSDANLSLGGGAIYLTGGASDSSIINCEFKNNSVSAVTNEARGGAIYAYGGSSGITIVNCLFYNNVCVSTSSGKNGGAIFLNHMEETSNDAEVINCTFYGNIASQGAGIYVSEDDDTTNKAVITNCILWNDPGNEIYTAWEADATVTYSQLDDSDYDTNTGCDDSYPCFVSASDHSLLSDSPCVDTGHNTEIDGYDYDLAGETRIVDGDESGPPPEVDKGCYEYQL